MKVRPRLELELGLLLVSCLYPVDPKLKETHYKLISNIYPVEALLQKKFKVEVGQSIQDFTECFCDRVVFWIYLKKKLVENYLNWQHCNFLLFCSTFLSLRYMKNVTKTPANDTHPCRNVCCGDCLHFTQKVPGDNNYFMTHFALQSFLLLDFVSFLPSVRYLSRMSIVKLHVTRF